MSKLLKDIKNKDISIKIKLDESSIRKRDKKYHDFIIPEKIWDVLETRCQGTDSIKKNRLTILTQEYEHSKPDESLTDLYDRFVKLLNGLSLVDKEYDIEDLNLKFLLALPERWDLKATIIRDNYALEETTLDEIYGMLKTHELEMEQRSKRNGRKSRTVAFVAEEEIPKEAASKKGKGKALITKSDTESSSSDRDDDSETESISEIDPDEEMMKLCALMVKGITKIAYRKFRRGKKFSRKGASSDKKGFRKSEGKGGKSDIGDYSNVKCYNCGEKGHISPDCRKGKSDKGKALVTKKKSWSDASDSEDEENYALMANADSSSDTADLKITDVENLIVALISKASTRQRVGRAGREPMFSKMILASDELGCSEEILTIDVVLSIQAADSSQAAILYTGLYLVAFGAGGLKAVLPSLGADQFDESDPEESNTLSSFFNWFLFFVVTGAIFGVTFLVWISENEGWNWGFGVSTFAVAITILFLCMGRSLYRNNVPKGSPLSRIMQVFVAAIRNRNLSLPENAVGFHEVHDKQSETLHRTNQFRNLLGFQVPGSSIPGIPLVFMFILIPIYDRVCVPILQKFTGIPTGVTHLQRIGVGLVLSAISMAVAGIVEIHRKSVAVEYNMVDSAEPLPMTVFWGSQKELDEAKMRFAAAEVSSQLMFNLYSASAGLAAVKF
ncbi:hypothetical protein AgCh_038406 [Apium graveolens]